jgi:D-beta-D-heptose 7-phosphate kinase/D-beta-D-heptose 1-phosphate adenosyltransferase
MILEKMLFENAKILVCGDFIIDQYVQGVVERISPEAPVPVLRKITDTFRLGGAANVAVNCRSLGAQTFLLSVSGPSVENYRLDELMEGGGLATDNLVLDPSVKPTIKTRFMADGHHILRVDDEETAEFSQKLRELLVKKFEELIRQVDVVVFSDYAKGFFHPSILEQFLKIAKQHHKRVLVDPKGTHYAKYRGCFCIKPNKKEAYKAANCDQGVSIESVAEILLDTVDAEYLLVTRSSEGMTLFDSKGLRSHQPAIMQEVVDVVGAGDTALALLAVGIATGMEMEDAVKLANVGSSIVVSRRGCSSVTLSDLKNRLSECSEEFNTLSTSMN